MAAALQTNIRPVKFPATFRALTKQSPAPFRVRCCAVNSAGKKRYNITLLPGDGIGPEVVSIAKNVLEQAGSLEGVEFSFREMPVGGAALDLVGVPLPEETVSAAKDSDAVLLGAIGGYKWDKNEKHLKPETGLLQLRAALKVFANLRPATVLPQLVDASTLKREVAEEEKAAKRIEDAVLGALNKGFRTGDIYSNGTKLVGCKEMGEEVLKSVDSQVHASV
ncbi:hypothetical protein BRARA_G03718 [Brassica rapa]|uniref:Isopropylmalate dehydrogenase-like domain-containing protein n=1 Tax=Brassica campestris TaxID=3711 RepID=A0A397YWX4_BRACM|nr:hypothetical protein BRARA_G03718 [Brassica rapa]